MASCSLFFFTDAEIVDNAIKEGVEWAKKEGSDQPEQHLPFILDTLAVAFGSEILKVIEGRVSTEVDALLSFDTEASIARGRRLIKLYEEKGIGRERILVKLAATWEGVAACKVLESEGIHCNMFVCLFLVFFLDFVCFVFVCRFFFFSKSFFSFLAILSGR